MIIFMALIALIVINIGLMVYQSVMDDKIKKLNNEVEKLISQMQEFRKNN